MEKQLEEANKILSGVKINHTKYGLGEIKEVLYFSDTDQDAEGEMVVSISFATATRSFVLVSAVNHGYISFVSEEDQKAYDKAFAISSEFTNNIKAKRKAEEEALKAKEAEIKKAERLLALEKSFQRRKEKLLDYVQTLNQISIDTTDDFYVSLGYIAKHAKNISAAMPDYLEGWFVGEFGDVPRRSVDSKKRTVNGYQMQWTLSMLIDLDTNDNMPLFLTQYLQQQDKKIKAIANTEFTYKILRDFGFEVGKRQDVANILTFIPKDKLASFTLGYNS